MNIIKENLQKNWDKSFKNLDNFLLYPNEHLIRFVNKFINKRKKITLKKNKKKCLDLGSGSGRHLIYLYENGFNVSGIDISKEAINQAKKILKLKKIKKKKINILHCSTTSMNFKDKKFDFCVSHGTLDSMMSEDADKTIKEVYRILKIGGFFYVDLISNNAVS